MAKIIGLGGIFFKSPDPAALRKWYCEVLGIKAEEWGTVFPFTENESGYNVWSVMKSDTEYFSPSTSSFMINFRVDDLDVFIAELIKKNISLCGDPQMGEYGKFAWILDPDGNKLELWQPPQS
ncbi:MAG TPA: VOC family protein [Flavobacteriales bacterium]|nr:VOC family protein [Flavobacteriales bacterium]HRE97399.1 VOC family protein [Flavobacteriales bacterium]HRJ34905.1 VOC family protein [Flavobacteriales bacterium]HRJ38935.1 VOC family protein [Flavobacteriales bacterium]